MPVWIPDKTGRFVQRPRYTFAELDELCEAVVTKAQLQRHGRKTIPITDDDVTVLLETFLGAEVRLFEEFPPSEGWIQGSTEFSPELIVRIARELTEKEENMTRFRSTIAHETGHVLTLCEAYHRQKN